MADQPGARPAAGRTPTRPDLYRRLKRELPAKRISRFINDAVRARLPPERSALDAAYKAARKETWRKDLADDWAATETEGWPR